MIIRRSFLLLLLLFTGLALQTSLFGTLALAGTKPELLLMVSLAIALVEGPAFGATAGFVLGLGQDLVLELPAGVGALTFTVAAYVLGRIRMQLRSPSAWMPVVLVAVMTFIAMLFYGGFLILLGQAGLDGLFVLRHAGLAAVYNGLLTPLAFPLVRLLTGFARPGASEVMR